MTTTSTERTVSLESAETTSSWRVLVTDVVLTVVVGALALWPLADVYDGNRWLVAGVAGLAVGIVAAVVGFALRLGPWSTTAIGLVGLVLVGPGAAGRDVMPSSDAVRDVLNGVVTVWRAALTAAEPLPAGDRHLHLLVPFLAALFGSVIACTVLWRSRRPQVAGLVWVALFVLAAGFGSARADADVAIIRGLALVVVLVVWIRWRAMRRVRTAWFRRIALTSAVILVAGGAATGIAWTLGSGSARDVLRDQVDPPFDVDDFASPLSAMRKYQSGDADGLKSKKMFTVQGEGVPRGALLPVATMDRFDGVVWNVAHSTTNTSSGTFERVDRVTRHDANDVVIAVSPDYGSIWVPTVGDVSGVKDGDGRPVPGEVLLNQATGTVMDQRGAGGRSYRLSTTLDVPPTPQDIESAETGREVPPPLDVEPPESLLTVVDSWFEDGQGSGPAGSQATFLAKQFSKNGRYSDGNDDGIVSVAGHSAWRLGHLRSVDDQLIGNAEQYASAMAVVARQRGLPSRVVFGFKVDSDDGVVYGKDVHSWVEVNLKELGWVPFDPTPPKNQRPKTERKDPDQKKVPHVLSPPTVPKDPSDAEQNLPQGAGEDEGLSILALLLAVLGVVVSAAKIGFLLSPIWGIVGLKFMRRRRRRQHADPVTRVSGGWKEITDRARDFGTRLPGSNTRYENSVQLASEFPESRAASLGAIADRHVFGPVGPTEEEVGAYWADVDTALVRMRKSQPWWKRPLAWLSPLSIPWRHESMAVWHTLGAASAALWRHQHVQRMMRAWPVLRRPFVRSGGGDE